jgi:hypothetical protein
MFLFSTLSYAAYFHSAVSAELRALNVIIKSFESLPSNDLQIVLFSMICICRDLSEDPPLRCGWYQSFAPYYTAKTRGWTEKEGWTKKRDSNGSLRKVLSSRNFLRFHRAYCIFTPKFWTL